MNRTEADDAIRALYGLTGNDLDMYSSDTLYGFLSYTSGAEALYLANLNVRHLPHSPGLAVALRSPTNTAQARSLLLIRA